MAKLKSPVISRRQHEHELRMQAMHVGGIAFINHGQGVTNGMQAVLHWLTDSRAKAQQIRADLYADSPETFDVGWDEGQKWINEAIEHLEQQIQDRKGGHAATHRAAADAPGSGDRAEGSGESPDH